MIFISTTNIGLARNENQDFLGDLDTDNGHLFVVCDGVSGLPNGKLASRTAVNFILDNFASPFNNPYEHIQLSLEMAHKAVKEVDPGLLGTTVVAIYFEEGSLFAAWCGDSRIYHFRDHSLVWMSRDHNVLHDMLNRGQGHGDIFLNPQAITRYLGQENNPEVDIHKISVDSGDKILICTDGLSNFILEPEIINTITEYTSKEASNIFERKLLSKELGAPDNFTWYIIEI